MEILNSELNLENFFNNLSSVQKRALILDYDGTLAPFRPERDKAMPYPGVREILDKIISTEKTRLVIVTGRRINDLIPLLGFDVSPEIWGSHGLERLKCNNEYQLTELDALARQGLNEANKWNEEEGLASLTEPKPSGVAFHWRGLSPEETSKLKKKIQKKWLSSAPNFGLILQEFDGGLELRIAGTTKATAVVSIIEEMGTDAVLAYMGDDLTDEDAFHALRTQDLGILVRNCLRETAADVWIKPPEELLDFLEKWIECGG